MEVTEVKQSKDNGRAAGHKKHFPGFVTKAIWLVVWDIFDSPSWDDVDILVFYYCTSLKPRSTDLFALYVRVEKQQHSHMLGCFDWYFFPDDCTHFPKNEDQIVTLANGISKQAPAYISVSLAQNLSVILRNGFAGDSHR